MAEKIKIAVRLDREDCRWLEARAAAQSKTASAVIREAISTARSQEIVLTRLQEIEEMLTAQTVETSKSFAGLDEKIDALGRLVHMVFKGLGVEK